MTSAVVSDVDEIRELTIDEIDQAGGGLSTAAKIGLVVFFVGLASFGGGLALGALLA